MAVGILLALAGLWIVLRTVTRDHSGRTLVDRLMGAAPAGSPA